MVGYHKNPSITYNLKLVLFFKRSLTFVLKLRNFIIYVYISKCIIKLELSGPLRERTVKSNSMTDLVILFDLVYPEVLIGPVSTGLAVLALIQPAQLGMRSLKTLNSLN